MIHVVLVIFGELDAKEDAPIRMVASRYSTVRVCFSSAALWMESAMVRLLVISTAVLMEPSTMFMSALPR